MGGGNMLQLFASSFMSKRTRLVLVSRQTCAVTEEIRHFLRSIIIIFFTMHDETDLLKLLSHLHVMENHQ